MLAWVMLVLLPLMGAGYAAMETVESRLSDRIEADLANARRLEAARIDAALSAYLDDATSLASGAHVKEFTAGVFASRSGGDVVDQIGGYDGFDPVDPASSAPLTELARAVQRKAQTTGSDALELRLVGADGDIYGQTDGFGWEPTDPSLIETVLVSEQPVFGNAFRSATGDDRLGVVTPIIFDDRAVGVLVLEMRLGPIVDLVVQHEGIGETSEAHIAQPTADGDAEFITLLRFERDAAFTKVVPASKNLPINWSLESPEGRVVTSPDYRGVESVLAIETLEQTGWGLVVKIDSDEAFAAVAEVRRVILVAGLVTALTIVIGYLAFLRPLSRRLRRTARAARRVAAGEHRSPIGDNARDEIGEMARGIDTLAADLAEDIRQRGEVERQLRVQATHDELTGLHNRKHAQQAIDALTAQDAVFSVLFLDLDGFKTVNDTFGHPVGDEVLRIVAARIRNDVDASAVTARWGGDEFVVILPATDAEAADAVAARLSRTIDEPIESSVGRHSVRCSVGRASSSSGVDSSRLLHEADSAMFTAKQRAKGLRVVSSDTLRAVEVALDEDRVEAWYQPMVRIHGDGTAELIGVEALARLRGLDGDIIAPGDFLPAITDTHLGAALDRRILASAMSTVATWRAGDLLPDRFSLAVNLCGASARNHEIGDAFTKLLGEHSLQANDVVFEISESSVTFEPEVIDRLRAIGARIALDDLGLQNSNIDRIIDLRPDVAKIDRRWIGDPDSTVSAEELAVLDALIGLCRVLDTDIVAEGVETKHQLDVLTRLHVDHLQGYLFAPPEPANSCLVVDLERRRRLEAGRIDHVRSQALAATH